MEKENKKTFFAGKIINLLVSCVVKVKSFQFVDIAQAKDGEKKLVKLDIFQSYQARVASP